MPHTAHRMDTVKPSAIVQVNNKANELKANGHEIINFSIGVPNFAPPQHILDAAHTGVDEHSLGYLPGKGSPELVKAWLDRLEQDGFHYEAKNVCATIGAKNALFSLFFALLDEGDELIFPAPYWSSYPDGVEMVGGKSVILKCGADQNYKLTAEQLEKAITPKTKAFLFNNPSNPTGMVYTQEEIQALADVLVRHPNVWVISDDIYDKMIYDGKKFHHLLHARPELKDRMIIVQSVSKAYGMPGWRVGMTAAPEAIIKQMLTLNANIIMNVPGVSMAAATAAFSGSHAFLDEQKELFTKRRDMVMDYLNGINGIICPFPEGAFYALPNVSFLFGKSYNGQVIENDVSLCNALLEHAGVAVVPGRAFGDNETIRISYACKPEDLEKGLQKIKEFMESCV